MSKNKGKGGKNRKRGKNKADDEKKELVFKEDGQEYAQVLRMLGNGRCEAMCIDNTKRLCHIRGQVYKKVWITAGDIILVGLCDYQGLVYQRGQLQQDIEFTGLQNEAAWRAGSWDLSLINDETWPLPYPSSRGGHFNENLHSCLRDFKEGEFDEFHKKSGASAMYLSRQQGEH